LSGTSLWARVWRKLVHVCQRWRYIIFASPRHLMLHITCTVRTPVRAMLDIWPAFPIEISSPYDPVEDNIIAVLAEHRDRICRIDVCLTSSGYSRFATAMQERFPALTFLTLRSKETLLELPDSFLGGSAPFLQYLDLDCIPFPTLPKLLLSTNGLVSLRLRSKPYHDFISPEAMATSLSRLTRLRSLSISFEALASPPFPRRRPPLTRFVLPSLTHLRFEGGTEYLEDLVAQIDAPLLQTSHISFFDDSTFGFQQLHRFISSSGTLRSLNCAKVFFGSTSTTFTLYSPALEILQNKLVLFIPHRPRRLGNGRLRSTVYICRPPLSLMSRIEQLEMVSYESYSTWHADMDNTMWLELFQLFMAVRVLHISYCLRGFILSALQQSTGGMAREVLPALGSLFLERYEPSGSEWQAIKPFITARQSSDHPVSIHRWKTSIFER
jgi:hypothetical protein